MSAQLPITSSFFIVVFMLLFYEWGNFNFTKILRLEGGGMGLTQGKGS